MIVVADTTPINYLVLVGNVHLLPELFGEVVIPQAVFAELRSSKAPEAVRNWLREDPEWLRVESVPQDKLNTVSDANLHLGEREAIALAQSLRADYLVIDEKAGRRVAIQKQLAVIGTLGVLEKADAEGLITDFPDILDRLGETDFYIRPELREALIQRHRARTGA